MVSGNKKANPRQLVHQLKQQPKQQHSDNPVQVTSDDKQTKLIKKVNAFEGHIIFLEGKLAVSETVSQLLEKKSRLLGSIL